MGIKMENDLIEKNLPWITPWFTSPDAVVMNLDIQERQILDEISARWNTTDKIDLFNSLGVRFGKEKVGGVIDKVVAAHIQPEWEELALKQPSCSIDDLIRLLWEPLTNQGFDVEIKKQTDGVQIHCTHCPHADLGRQIGGADWLYHLVCSGDPHTAAGFNPQIGFRRTMTLMEGLASCDHFYFLKT
jgi:predicted ArsR family transcriptional regulator